MCPGDDMKNRFISYRAVERDTLSKTARTNLAAALILKGEYARAQAEYVKVAEGG